MHDAQTKSEITSKYETAGIILKFFYSYFTFEKNKFYFGANAAGLLTRCRYKLHRPGFNTSLLGKLVSRQYFIPHQKEVF